METNLDGIKSVSNSMETQTCLDYNAIITETCSVSMDLNSLIVMGPNSDKQPPQVITLQLNPVLSSSTTNLNTDGTPVNLVSYNNSTSSVVPNSTVHKSNSCVISTNLEGVLKSNENSSSAVKPKKRPSRQYCSAINCNINTTNSPDISFFRYPKDIQRCKRWLINVRRDDLFNKRPEDLYHCYRLCAKHFEDCMFSNGTRTRLFTNAVPTLFDIPNYPLRTITLKRKLPNRTESSQQEKAIRINDLVSETSTTENPIQQKDINRPQSAEHTLSAIVVAVDDNSNFTRNKHSTELNEPVAPIPVNDTSLQDENTTLNDQNFIKSCICIECQPENYKVVGTQTDHFVCTKEERKRVAMKMKALQRKIRKLEKKLQTAKERFESEQAVSTEKAMEKLKTELPEEAFYLLQSMMKISKEKYSQQEKNFFLSFYLQARNGYQYLRDRQIHMPHPKTVQKWKRQISSLSETASDSVEIKGDFATEQVQQLLIQQTEDAELAYSIAIIATDVDLENAQYCLI